MADEQPSAAEIAAMAAWANAAPIDRALGEVEEWARAVLVGAGLSTGIRNRLWYSDNRERLGEPEKDRRWLAWRALDSCLLARQRLAEGMAETALEHACEAWRFAFWHEVSARRRTVAKNRAISRKAHDKPDEDGRRAAFYNALAQSGSLADGQEQSKSPHGNAIARFERSSGR